MFEIQALKSELMVLATSCRTDTQYNAFVNRYQAYLADNEKAFDEYFNTVADYNIAQFQMFHALGYPAQDVANCQVPGEVVPVDTSRPGYLPEVGTGPPPATRWRRGASSAITRSSTRARGCAPT